MSKKETRSKNDRRQRQNPLPGSSPEERNLYDKHQKRTWRKTATLALKAGELHTTQKPHVLTFCFRGFLHEASRKLVQGCRFWCHEPHAVYFEGAFPAAAVG